MAAVPALLVAVVLVLAPAASASETADAYLKHYGETALEQLGEPGLSEEELATRFEKLLREGFDVPAIGQFVVARYWRAAGEQERSEFLEVFGEYLTQRFLPVFRDYQGGTFETQAPKVTDSDGVVWVPLRLERSGGDPIRTEWLLRESDDGGFRILDIKAEGTSMAITLRDEYASVIRREGSLDGLTREIQRLLAQGAFAPRNG
ncbi:MAG: ABC transporter substrate-binding protein [Tistlia sp.]|uniref:phospholipid-binding protein MlaC n=1 Tax=Tistlia sp. TaxID=3057121 RepID=UPI0034A5AE24